MKENVSIYISTLFQSNLVVISKPYIQIQIHDNNIKLHNKVKKMSETIIKFKGKKERK